MSDISKIQVDGVTYDVKDGVIRDKLFTDRITINSTEEIDPEITQVIANMTNEDMRVVRFWCTSDTEPLLGGMWWLIFFKYNNNNAAVIALSYRSNVNILKKVNINGSWSDWITFTGTLA